MAIVWKMDSKEVANKQFVSSALIANSQDVRNKHCVTTRKIAPSHIFLIPMLIVFGRF